MPGTPNDVIVTSNGVPVTIHTFPSCNNAGTSDTVAAPFQGVNGGIPVTEASLVINPTSTLIRPANTTNYAQSNIIASSTTAGSIVVPSITVARLAGGSFAIRRLRLNTNSATASWGTATFAVNLWAAAATYTNGDGAAYAVATGSAGFLGAFTFASFVRFGDGSSGIAAPAIGTDANIRLVSGQVIYWDLQYTAAPALTPISGQTFTLTAEVIQN